MDIYKIVRFTFKTHGKRVVKRGLTLEEAQAHCNDPETSSSTCTKAAGKRRTAQRGPWFDGYTRDETPSQRRLREAAEERTRAKEIAEIRHRQEMEHAHVD